MSLEIRDASKIVRRDELGEGVHGRSFCASDTGTSEPKYRLKLFSTSIDQDVLIEHLRSYSSVVAPTVVRPLGFIPRNPRSHRSPAYFTDYMASGPLSAFVASSPVPLQTQLSILFCVASAMKTLHSHGLPHGRLHPENVLIVNRCDAAVVDYGRFRFATPNGPERRIAFIAPEIQSGSAEVSEKTDIYSFAMLAFFVLTGRCPGGRKAAPLLQGLRPEVPRTVPRQLHRIISLCWSHDVAERPRFADVVEMFLNIESDEVNRERFLAFSTPLECHAVRRWELAGLQAEVARNRERLARIAEAVGRQSSADELEAKLQRAEHCGAAVKRLNDALAKCRQRIDEVAEHCARTQALVGKVDGCERHVSELPEGAVAHFDGLPTSRLGR
jgi:serine/threonine protein kinase